MAVNFKVVEPKGEKSINSSHIQSFKVIFASIGVNLKPVKGDGKNCSASGQQKTGEKIYIK